MCPLVLLLLRRHPKPPYLNLTIPTTSYNEVDGVARVIVVVDSTVVEDGDDQLAILHCHVLGGTQNGVPTLLN